jgi:hypothetical protein
MDMDTIAQYLNLILAENISLKARLECLQESVARVEMRQLAQSPSDDIHANEFQVFSQWGEDGIIQFLLNRVPIANKIFVEFGVGGYQESNTRFLLKHNNWSGLIIGASEQSIEHIRRTGLFWRYNLKAICAFITRDNINQLISEQGISGDIGILSIDLDGNDYWVWEVIDCIQPRIVICEYNSLFGAKHNISSIYDDHFLISEAHFSGLYWGASIGAFSYLAEQKGYSLVGSNTAGNNVFFVRNDVAQNVPTYTPETAYVKSQFRISRDQQGELSFLDFAEGLQAIADMPVCEVDTNRIITMKELLQI